MGKVDATQRFLISRDVARLADLTPAGVRLAVKRGELTAAAVTLNGIRLFERAEVDRYLAARRPRQRKVA